MQKKNTQMSLYDIYKDVAVGFEQGKPLLFRRLNEYIDWDVIIPAWFCTAFYRRKGHPREYSLVGFLKGLVLQRIFGYTDDAQLLNTLRHSREMRDFCGFAKVPDASKLTRFKQAFMPYIAGFFESLVELTEPVCRKMDSELADSLIFDTTGIESHIAENNPKFFNAKLKQAKALSKKNPDCNPYKPANKTCKAMSRGNVKNLVEIMLKT